MIKTLFARYKASGQEKRWGQYRLQLGLMATYRNDLKHFPGQLCDFWRKAQLGDFTSFSARARISTEFNLAHRRIDELIGFLEEFNQLMAAENEGHLEILCQNTFVDRKPVVMDHYFSDEHLYEVDMAERLTRLRGLLLSHCHILEGFDNQYYQRQANRLYLEIYALTVHLIEALTQQEIEPIERIPNP